MFGFAAAPEMADCRAECDAIVVLVTVLPRSPISVLPQRGGRLRRLLLHVFSNPVNIGVNTKDSALRSCVASSSPLVVFKAAFTMWNGPA